MTFADAIVTLFEADTGAGGVATLLTGGIYTYDETGRLGVNRDNTPSAFNTTTGLLKPCCVVKDRAQIPDSVSDDATQQSGYRQIVELWFYDDGDAGYATINSAMLRAYRLLHGQHVTYAQVHWAGDIPEQRDEDLDKACMARSDYEIRALKS